MLDTSPSPGRRAILLVDYDNISPSRKERSVDDVETNVSAIIEGLTRLLSSNQKLHINEVALRLYGGWLHENGVHTDKGGWLLRRLSTFRTRRHGIRVYPTLVRAIAQRETMVLCGSYRRRPDRSEQKMVDMMLAVDLLHFRRVSTDAIIVASDDDDLVPALLASADGAATSESILLLRHREQARGVNDAHLANCGVEISILPDELRRI